jgi:ribosomal protein L37E
MQLISQTIKQILKKNKMGNVICTTCGTENPNPNKYCSNCGYELTKIKTESIISAIQPPAKAKTVGKKSKLWKIILGIVVLAVVLGLSYFVIQPLFVKAPLVDRAMMKIAAEINKSCPMMINADTRFDNAEALPGNVFQYNFTLIHLEKATADPEEMRNLFGPSIVNEVKTNPQMKPQRDRKTTVNYCYKDKAGLFFLMIAVTPDQYE